MQKCVFGGGEETGDALKLIVFFVGDMGKYLTGGSPDRLLAAFPLIWELRLFKCSKKRTLFSFSAYYSRGVWVSGVKKAVNREKRGEGQGETSDRRILTLPIFPSFLVRKKALHLAEQEATVLTRHV